MIIDSHVHIYPEKIQHKAAESIGNFYGIKMQCEGTFDELLSNAESYGIEKILVHSVATSAHQVSAINDFIASRVHEYNGKLIGFATMHPDFDGISEEIDRMIELGLKGIKLHPDFQNFDASGVKAAKIFKAAQGKLPILIHSGDSRHALSNPCLIQKVLEAFPDLTLIAAHFGGWSEWDKVIGTLHGAKLYTDTSSSFYALTDDQIIEFIEYFGEDKVLFGTDFPMWQPGPQIERIKGLNISQEAKEKIFSLNAIKLLNV